MYVVMPNFLILDSQSNLMSTRPERMGHSNSRGVPVLPVTWHQKSLKTTIIQKLPMSTHSEFFYGKVSPNDCNNKLSILLSTRRLTLSPSQFANWKCHILVYPTNSSNERLYTQGCDQRLIQNGPTRFVDCYRIVLP